jgi:hypothetical protein
VDLSKVNESTLEACKKSKHIPADLIIDAALELAKRLRKELDETKAKLKPLEYHPKMVGGKAGTYSPADVYHKPSNYGSSYSNNYSSVPGNAHLLN